VADVRGRELCCGLGLLHRVLAVGYPVSVGDPGERFRLFGSGDLDQTRFVRETSQEPNQIVLVLCEFVHVVRGDDGRSLVLDQPPELPVGHHVLLDTVPVEDRKRVGRRITPHVPALDVDPVDYRVERTRTRTHGLP
jgi:hypothetical protein